MQAVFFTEGSLIKAILPDAGIILIGLLLFLFGVVLVLSLLLKSNPKLFPALIAGSVGILLLLLSIVIIDLSGDRTVSVLGEFTDLSELLASHRYLLIQLPFILLSTAVVILFVYGKNIADKHASIYRRSVTVSLWLSFACVLLIALESMI